MMGMNRQFEILFEPLVLTPPLFSNLRVAPYREKSANSNVVGGKKLPNHTRRSPNVSYGTVHVVFDTSSRLSRVSIFVSHDTSCVYLFFRFFDSYIFCVFLDLFIFLTDFHWFSSS